MLPIRVEILGVVFNTVTCIFNKNTVVFVGVWTSGIIISILNIGFFSQLAYCVVQFLEKDASLTEQVSVSTSACSKLYSK